MATHTLSTRVSRRAIIAGGAAAALPAVAALTAAADTEPLRRLAALARQYGRAIDDLTDWIDLVETRYGPGAYDQRPDCQPRYAELIAREDRAVAQLAAARPESVAGLAVKLRAAFWCDDLRHATEDCNPDILLPALADLERLAATGGA